MRVISGVAARRKLTAPKGLEVRPTTDRIKETLFNILAPRIYGSVFLDLYSGSGAIGIEALSRGAEKAVFVDSSKVSTECIKSNLDNTHLSEKALVLRMDSNSAISRLCSEKEQFDIIFIDPPYNKGLEMETLMCLDRYHILAPDGCIIIECSATTTFDYMDDLGFVITREKKYGSNKHIFIAYR